jgi:hypothetical protein
MGVVCVARFSRHGAALVPTPRPLKGYFRNMALKTLKAAALPPFRKHK